MKVCTKCEIEKPLDEFHAERRNHDGRRGACKLCVNDQNKAVGCTIPTPRAKQCAECDTIKPRSEFTVNRWSKDGLHRLCRSCNYPRAKDDVLRRTYGISLEDYERMMVEQQGACQLCKRPPKNRALSVDHCHETGHVRGLLCWPCNRFLGHIKDCPKTLERMIEYLKGTV